MKRQYFWLAVAVAMMAFSILLALGVVPPTRLALITMMLFSLTSVARNFLVWRDRRAAETDRG